MSNIELVRVRHLLLAVLFVLYAPLAAANSTWSIGELMAALSANKNGRASFVEQKYIGILDAPVQSSGELVFEAPDRLEKRTLKPKAEAIVLKGDQITVERDKRSMRMSLQAYPQIAAFVDSIRGTLAGDQLALERTYYLKLEGGADKWLLTLVPRAADTLEIINRVRVSGQRGEVRSIEIDQADGDRSVMTITRQSGS